MGVIRRAAKETKTAAYARALQNTPRRADDRRVTGNTEGRRSSFNDGFFAQTEAKLTNSDDVGQGKGRAQERAWGAAKGAGGWTPY